MKYLLHNSVHTLFLIYASSNGNQKLIIPFRLLLEQKHSRSVRKTNKILYLGGGNGIPMVVEFDKGNELKHFNMIKALELSCTQLTCDCTLVVSHNGFNSMSELDSTIPSGK